jgi:hypothetical protein
LGSQQTPGFGLVVKLRVELLIFIVAADPKPGHRVTLKDSNGAMGESHSHGPHIIFRIDAFEVKRWMLRVF